jgi:hypothetical protein
MFFFKQTILQIAHQRARTINQSDNKPLIKKIKKKRGEKTKAHPSGQAKPHL